MCSRPGPSSSPQRGELKKVPPVAAFPNQHCNAITSWARRQHGGGQACLRVSWRPLAVRLAFVLGAGAALAEGPDLGKPIDRADIAAWDISIQPDGTGLPPGGGTPAEGAKIYARKVCAVPRSGRQGRRTASAQRPLVGGGPITDISAAVKTIANFWPYSTTVFDYIRRAMPWQQPMTLTNDEVYALTAYILASTSSSAKTTQWTPRRCRKCGCQTATGLWSASRTGCDGGHQRRPTVRLFHYGGPWP